ncbi:hypothetical protein [Halalkalicoccus subterraneus]|nr:hypothetical protein [Halalkalicoccus subterraneus]
MAETTTQFDRLLAPSGPLVIGKTETVPRSCADRLEPIDEPLRIYGRA